jgi:hypothetical protein
MTHARIRVRESPDPGARVADPRPVDRREIDGSALRRAVSRISQRVRIVRADPEIVIADARGRRTCTAKLTCLHRDSRP